jgi:GNAT superfamily N-acetyltransferase
VAARDLVIREAVLDDAARVAALSSAVYPDELTTERGLRHLWSVVPERVRRRMWVAEEAGRIVGFASATLSLTSGEPGACVANVYVHPEQRRRGIGAALWDQVERHLTEIGGRHANSFGLDEEASRQFMGARGFEVALRQRMSRLELASLPAPPEPPAGVELRPYASLADPRPVYELEVEALQDVPVDQPLDDVRWEEWLDRWWRDPELDADASLLVLVDGEPAAFTTLLSDPASARTVSGMTGTARRFRGRGLALLVKHHALARAAAGGIATATTENDETNRPMLAVNERLGYRPSTTNATFSRRRSRTSA